MSFTVLEGPNGEPVAAKADEDGALRVTATVNAEASGLAKEETLAAIASTVVTSSSGPGAPGILTYPAQPMTLTSVAPPDGTLAQAVHPIAMGGPITDAFDVERYPVILAPGSTVSQGDGDRSKKWFVASSPDGVAVEQVATAPRQDALFAEVEDDATTADVRDVRDRIPAALEGGRLSVETELVASGGLATEAQQSTTNSKLDTLEAGKSTAALQATGNASAVSTATNTSNTAASVASIDLKTPALVGGRVPVDNSGVTQPVSDAGGSLTVDDGGASLTVDGTIAISNYPASQNVVVTSSALPGGAATEASTGNIAGGVPDALGAGGGMKIEGVAGGTAVPISNASLVAIEPDVEEIRADADASRVAEQSIDGGTPNALGAGGGMQVEGVGTAGVPAGGVASVQGVRTTPPIAITPAQPTRNIPLDYAPVLTTAGAVATSLVVRAGPCWLVSVFVSYPTTGADVYVTAYNLTSAPSNGAAATARVWPGVRVLGAAGGNPGERSISFNPPLKFSTGCVLAIESSAAPVNTTLAANGAVIAAAYAPST